MYDQREGANVAEYRYKGYTIRQITRSTRTVRTLIQWDIFAGEQTVKRGFGSVDIAKHYIDKVCRRNEDDRREQIRMVLE